MPAWCANPTCGKKTWRGCGQHVRPSSALLPRSRSPQIASVMDKVPQVERCVCEEHSVLPPGVLPPVKEGKGKAAVDIAVEES